MKNLRISRCLWLFAGACFLISFVLSLETSKSALLPVLNGITCILMFINAFINHRKIIKENRCKNNKDL